MAAAVAVGVTKFGKPRGSSTFNASRLELTDHLLSLPAGGGRRTAALVAAAAMVVVRVAMAVVVAGEARSLTWTMSAVGSDQRPRG